MITFKGYPEKPGLYGGYNVIRQEQVIGCIEVCGYFRNTTNTALTAEEKSVIKKMCQRVYEMPSEWGLLGVGESPTVPYEQYTHKNTDLD